MVTEIVDLDLSSNSSFKIITMQGDIASRFIEFHLTYNNETFDLTGKTVSCRYSKDDKTVNTTNLVINDKLNGICTLDVPYELMKNPYVTRSELVIKQSNETLSTIPFTVEVVKSLVKSSVVESSDEFDALIEALWKVEGFNSRLNDINSRLGNVSSLLDTKAKKGKNVRIIAKENGDYTLPSQCVDAGGDTMENPITMIVHPGTYEDQVYIKQWSRINMIGTNKKDCIIVNHGGGYSDEPLITAGERYIANLTFRATHQKSSVSDKNQWKSYAFHGDKSSGGDGTTLVENCRFESYHNASVGLGIYNNQTFHFRNCEFYSKIDWDSTQANVGAFFAHNNVKGGVTNGRLILENCTFFMDNDRAGYGHACYINDANLTDGDKSGNALNVMFINCTLIRNVGGFVNALRVDNSNSISKISGSIDLNMCSNGNNISQLNAPQMIWQNPELPDGITNFNGSFAQCRYGKDASGRTIIEGLIKGCRDDTDLFTLPVGFRPKYNKYFTILSNNGSNLSAGSMIVNSNGVVRLDKNIGSAFVSIECSFFAEQ